ALPGRPALCLRERPGGQVERRADPRPAQLCPPPSVNGGWLYPLWKGDTDAKKETVERRVRLLWTGVRQSRDDETSSRLLKAPGTTRGARTERRDARNPVSPARAGCLRRRFLARPGGARHGHAQRHRLLPAGDLAGVLRSSQ